MACGGQLRPVRLILASRSPRRRELLAEAGYQFEVILPSEKAEEETLRVGESAEELVARLAWQKAADVVQRVCAGMGFPPGRPFPEQPKADKGGTSDEGKGFPPHSPGQTGLENKRPLPEVLVIGCDTVVECQGQILGKPTDRSHARHILTMLSGQEHRVYSGLCLWPLPVGTPKVQVAVSRLRMDPLHPDQLEEYLQSGQWEGKAGAFGYQDRLGWVHLLEGSASNVVGLPLELLTQMLADIGYPPAS